MQTRKSKNYKEEKKESLVSPIISGLISAIIPGLGQIFARELQRGLLVFA